jgi:hypothetical protein
MQTTNNSNKLLTKDQSNKAAKANDLSVQSLKNQQPQSSARVNSKDPNFIPSA